MGEKLTVIVPAFNEERNIRECLESVTWADEVIVVDSFSTDATPEICRSFGVKLVQHEYLNSAAQKNWILPQTRHRWVLIVDADERVTPALRQEIAGLLGRGPDCGGYWVRRRNRFMGKEIRFCGWQRDKVLRFFDRDRGRYEEKHVHAEVQLEGKAGVLRSALSHDSYRDFSSYLRKLDRYTDWGAQDLVKKGRRASVFDLVFRPPARFFRMYVLQLGVLDGVRGLMVCTLGATSVFMKYAKLWRQSAGGRGT
ncbi:MAG: glycosyltransferase family 2 protein [Candidatus Eisenbacteria bacterium]|nr:glycosyltransferase family 2 protein [Candidatus Eisenbacteria bacterium]